MLTTIFAPGGQITGAGANGGTVAYSGTSQAAPLIAGLVADMQQLALQVSGHLLSVDQLKQTMLTGSVPIFDGDNENDNVPNTYTAYCRLDALGWGIQFWPTCSRAPRATTRSTERRLRTSTAAAAMTRCPAMAATIR